MDAELESYVLAHIAPEPEHLARLDRHTQLHHLYPHQCSGHLQGRVLSMLSALTAPRRILELGTFTGYSALCLAEGLAPDGELHTVEHNDEDADALTELFAADSRIKLHIGDAAELIEELPGPWDLAFIDANKREYVRYLQLLLPKMAPGALIIADNTLWAGKVADPSETDAQTRGIREFNDLVKSLADRLQPVILPLRDGMTLMRVAK
ncbi:MAG: O-methyltransferase [Muribaculaceae bacterium]|nr:O-methyltransferase [Muribaculaceae bacterium]